MLYHALYIPEGSPPLSKEIVNQPDIAKYVLDWGQPDDMGFVAIDKASRRQIGAVWIRMFNSHNPGYGYFAEDIPELSIAVLPGHRGLGIGTQLLNHMLAKAAGKYPGLSLSVTSANPAKRLYERLGFQVVNMKGASLTMLLDFRTRD